MKNELSASDQEEEKMSRKLMSFLLVAFVAVGMALPVSAGGGDANHIFDITPASQESFPGGNVSLSAQLTTTIDAPAAGVSGWSYGVCTDPASVSVDSVSNADSGTANGGGAPGFESLTIDAGGAGWTHGVVIDLFGAVTLPPGTAAFTMSSASCTAVGAEGTSSGADLCGTLGSPPVAVVVVVSGASIAPTTNDGTINIVEVPPASPFIRGDSNNDGGVNIADVVWLLSELFLGGPSTDCPFADDANSDGNVDTADAVYVANYQFMGGAAPAAPFPGCDLVAGQVLEDCTESDCP